MTRRLYVMRQGKLIEVERAPATPRIHVISDTMPETLHPVNGRHYESKSEFRKITRAAGCTEMGTDPQAAPRAPKSEHLVAKEIEADIIDAYKKVQQGYKPAPVENAGEAGFDIGDL